MGLSVYDVVIEGRREETCGNCKMFDECQDNPYYPAEEDDDPCDDYEQVGIDSLYDVMFGKEN